ncbi:MAG: hypothetical protein NUW13_14625 [candidate division KSB1 bacterium]|nr:hypothetical protein [candidate division KSB1 bacterium]
MTGIPPALLQPTLYFLSPAEGEFVDALTTSFRWGALCPYPWYIDRQFELCLWPPMRSWSTERVFLEFPTTSLLSAEAPSGTYHWTVCISSPAGRFASPDTFTMSLPTANSLQFASLQSRCRLSLGPSERVQALAAEEPFLYVLVRDTTAPSKYEGWKPAVIAVHQDSCQVWNIQEIRGSENDPFAIGNDRAFFVYTPVLYAYSVSPDKVFTFRQFLSSHWFYNFRDLVICGDYVIVLSEKSDRGSIIVLNASDLGRIRQAVTVPLLGWRLPPSLAAERIDSLLFLPPYLYVASGDWGVFDMSNPEMPRLVAHVPDAGRVKGISAMGNRLCTWGADSAVKLYDVSAPASPRLLHSEMIGAVWSVVCLGELLCVQYAGGIHLAEYRLAGPLRLRGFFPCSVSGVAITKDHLYVPSADGSAVEVYKNLKTGVAGERATSVGAQLEIEDPYPNPCNAASHFRFSLPSKQHVRVDIFNVRGGLVCRLWEGVCAPGEHLMSWDGRDSKGELVASGVYLVRLEAGKMQVTRKLFLVR